jgi:hypothetical protein
MISTCCDYAVIRRHWRFVNLQFLLGIYFRSVSFCKPSRTVLSFRTMNILNANSSTVETSFTLSYQDSCAAIRVFARAILEPRQFVDPPYFVFPRAIRAVYSAQVLFAVAMTVFHAFFM